MKTVLFTFFIQVLFSKEVWLTSYVDFPWTSLVTQFNLIAERVKENDGKMLKSDGKLLSSISTDVESYCEKSRIRVFHGPKLNENSVVAGIPTETYVLVFPNNMIEERYAWVLPAVICRANRLEGEKLTITYEPSKNINSEVKSQTTTEYKITAVGTKHLSNSDEDKEESSNDDPSEEEERAVSLAQEHNRALALEKELLLSSGSGNVEGEIKEVYYEISTTVEHVKIKEDQDSEISEQKHLIFVKDEEDRLNKALKQEEYLARNAPNRMATNNNEGDIKLKDKEDWENTQSRNAEAEKRKQDHAILKTGLKKKKDRDAADVAFIEGEARRSTADTINKDLPKIPHRLVKEENRRESEMKAQYVKPEEPKKELLPVKTSRHWTLRRKLKGPIPP